jgi:hypothetical protein
MLADEFQPTPKYCQQSSIISLLPAQAFNINLFEISAVAYRLLSRRKNHKTFAASLNELDSLLANSQATIDYSPDKRLVDECLAKFP